MAQTGAELHTSTVPTRRKPARDDSDFLLEKDDVELRLEKALFGDDTGFLDSLQPRKTDRDRQIARISDDEGEDVDQDDLNDVPDEELFFLDAGAGPLPDAIAQALADKEEEDEQQRREPVWHDSDDDRLTVSLANNRRLRKLRNTEDDDIVNGREYIKRLRRQYERLHPTPDWVSYARKRRKTSTEDRNSDMDSDSDTSMTSEPSLTSSQPLAELLRSAGSLTKSSATSNKKLKLRPDVIDISRLPSIASSGPSTIDSLQFHPYYPILLTAGPSSTMSLYHVSPHPPNPNPLLTSLHLKGTPIHTATFCTPAPLPSSDPSQPPQDQTTIFLSSRRRYFHTLHLSTAHITRITRPLHLLSPHQRTTERFKISPCSTYMALVGSSRAAGGVINVLDALTSQWICTCRIDGAGGVADFDWYTDGSGFAVVGKNGEVTEYDVVRKGVIARWSDEGAVGTTTLSIGGADSRWVAVGSSSGIVNIYDRKSAEFTKMMKAEKGLNGSSSNTNSATNTRTTTTTNRPTPLRTLSHLTTPISSLTFSPCGQLLVLSSRWKKNALKLVHLPSCTVYRNWPTEKTGLGRVSAVAVGRGGGGGEGGLLVAVGSESGAVRLWEVRG